MDAQLGPLSVYGPSQLSTVQTEDLRVLGRARIANLNILSDDATGSASLTTNFAGDLTLSAAGSNINFHASDTVRILNTTAATSTSTGALLISGGLGIAGDSSLAKLTCTSTTAPQIRAAYSAGIHTDITTDSAGDLLIDTTGNDINLHSSDTVRVLNTTAGNSAITGALICSGDITTLKSMRLTSSLVLYRNVSSTDYTTITSRTPDGILQIRNTREGGHVLDASCYTSGISIGFADVIDLVAVLPESPNDGDRYILTTTGNIQQYNAGVWSETATFRRYTVYVSARGTYYIKSAYQGLTSDWQPMATYEAYRNLTNYPTPIVRMHYAVGNDTYATIDVTSATNLHIGHNSSISTMSLDFGKSVTVRSGEDIIPTDTQSGALIISGGLRLTKRLYNDSTEDAALNSETGAIQTLGGVRAAKKIICNDITDATSTGTGALIIAGGASVAKSLHVGESIIHGPQWEDLQLISSSRSVGPEKTIWDYIPSTTISGWYLPGTSTTTIEWAAQMPHAWLPGSEINLHLHLIFNDNIGDPAAVSRFQCYMNIGNQTYEMVEYSVIQNYITGTFLYRKPTILTLITRTAAQMANFGASTILTGKITREWVDIATTTDNRPCWIVGFDIHYQRSRMGTVSEIS